MKWPWVSRALYEAVSRSSQSWELRCDEVQARYDRLVQQVVSLKRKGFETPYSGQRVRSAAAEPEKAGLERAEGEFVAGVRAREREFLDKAKSDLIGKGTDPVTAEREARRLLTEATDMQPS